MSELADASAAAKGEKLVYTAKTHTTGGREGGSRSSDGRLDIRLSIPGAPGRRHKSGAAVRCRVVGLFRRSDGGCGPQKENQAPR